MTSLTAETVKQESKYYKAKYVKHIPIPNYDYNYYMMLSGIIKYKCDKKRVVPYYCAHADRMFVCMYDNNGVRRNRIDVAYLIADTLLPRPKVKYIKYLRFRDDDHLNCALTNMYWSATKHNYTGRYVIDSETGLIYYNKKIARKHLQMLKPYQFKRRVKSIRYKKYMKVIKK
jgi:hypothetical protein